MSDLSRLMAAARVPESSFLMFGADPCHTPAKESRNPGSENPATCSFCGGAIRDRYGRTAPNRPAESDPVRDYEAHVGTASGKHPQQGAARAEPMTTVCGHCDRGAYDGTVALTRAKLDEDGEMREGFEDLANPNRDTEHRTDLAVRPTGEADTPDLPLTRKALRAARFGHGGDGPPRGRPAKPRAHQNP